MRSNPLQKSNRFNNGVTLTEVLVVVVFIPIFVVLLNLGIKATNYLSRQKALVEAQTEAERVLYMISRDVRNAGDIEVFPPDKIELDMFDFSLGYDARVGSNMFDPAMFGKVTYEFVEQGGNVYIKKSINFPANPVRNSSHLMMKNIIETPTDSEPLFNYGEFGTLGASSAGVDVVIRLKIPFWVKGRKKFNTSILKTKNFKDY